MTASRIGVRARFILATLKRPAILVVAGILPIACGSTSEKQTFSAPSPVRCAVQVSTDTAAFPPSGGSSALHVTVERECTWTAKSEAPWLSLAASEGQGAGSIQFTVASNAEPSVRSTGVMVNDQRLQVTQQGKPCEFSLSSTRESVENAGGDRTVQVRASSSQCDWTASANVPWIAIVSGRDGRGNGTVTFRVAAADGPPRIGTLTITGQTLQIEQGTGCSYSIAPASFSIGASGGERQANVSAGAGCTWTAASNTPWITLLSGRDGSGNGTVTFRVDAEDGPPRTGTLTIAGQTVQVEQGTGCAYSVGTDTFSVEASGGDRQVAVSAGQGCAWTATSNAAWITISSGSGSGAGTVAFHVAATDGPARTGTLTVGGRTVTVVQAAGCRVSVSPSSLNQSAAGGSATISVDVGSGCSWSATTDVPWITIVPGASGSGKGQVQVAVAANVGPARSGSVTVGGQKVTVTQASGCTYSVTPAGQQVPPGGGPAAASVTTNAGCTWSASSAVTWIALSTPSGSGPGQAAFTVAPNQGPPRTGTLTIAGQVHTVDQASACTWSFVPPSHLLDANGGTGNVLVFVTGACTWTATSTVDWIQMTAGASGVGGGLLQFVVAPNPGPARTGVILIGGEKYLVNQTGR